MASGRGVAAAARVLALLLGLAFAGPALARNPQSAAATRPSDAPPRLWSDDDTFAESPEIVPGSPEGQLLEIRRAILEGDTARALSLSNSWIDRHERHPLRAEALLLRGDALFTRGDEYKALFDYEAVATLYPGSEVYVTALEREFAIAVLYANGKKKKFLGMRLFDAGEEAQELLIRIQERLPGSQLAEDAGMALADYYFRRGEMDLAGESYQLFIENYPRSTQIRKARLRLIYSRLASFKGPQFDSAGLQDARAQLTRLEEIEPLTAQQIGSASLILRIDESRAAKLLEEARWYLRTRDPLSAELSIRRLLARYPQSVAALRGIELGAQLLPDLPTWVREQAPDYVGLKSGAVPMPAPRGGPSPEDAPPVPAPNPLAGNDEAPPADPEANPKADPAADPKADPKAPRRTDDPPPATGAK